MYLQAIDRQPPSRLGRAILELGDDGVVHVLFLFTKKCGTNRVEGVASQLVFSLHKRQKIELKTTGKWCFFRFSSSVSFGREVSLLNFGLDT